MLTSVTGNLCIHLCSSEKSWGKKIQAQTAYISMKVLRRLTYLLAIFGLVFGLIYIFKNKQIFLYLWLYLLVSLKSISLSLRLSYLSPLSFFFFFSLNQNKFELSVLLEQNLITLTAYRLICLPGGLDCLFFRNNLISASSLFFSF